MDICSALYCERKKRKYIIKDHKEWGFMCMLKEKCEKNFIVEHLYLLS